ncbi:DUF5946 family protein [Geodermatophilus marinus]|uniref:DUF5946 family protein n=1 Tax=Geodermatophilus sp. LHW52908 TaxID=2303986 RepID=UPI0011C137F4|nr:DUF5946 family protein [Geodermatophilus sp. LHW52908]
MPTPPPAVPPARTAADAAVQCPGCGSVLAALETTAPEPPAAPTAACARLFEETTRGLRDEEGADPRPAATLALAEAAWTAQHAAGAGPDRVRAALDALATRTASPPVPEGTARPAVWRTTIADVAADLDVIDLAVLVDSWARAVLQDWRRDAAG